MATIGGYEVVRPLGKGGMSEVYEVERPGVGTRYALKLFSYPRDDASVRERFETEGRLLARLNHPRIVKVVDLGTDAASGRPFFVMDLVLNAEGVPQALADVPEGSADEETIGRWYDDVREGLAYVHGKGVVHRDVKLQNVMIGPDGHAVLADFGISRIFNPADGAHTVVDPVQTVIQMQSGKGPVMGSIGYMAPELELGLKATPQSDWYALGVIVYKLLTGTWCDARTDLAATLDTYDPAWLRIVPKLLHANPAGRECLGFAEERRRVQEEREAQLEERYLEQKRRGHLARHAARYAGGAALLLAVGLGWMVHEYRAQRAVWQLKFEAAGARPAVPTFDELFKVPAAARADEVQDANGETVEYSRAQYEAARVDALVLTQRVMSGLESGTVTLEKAVEDFERFAARLENDTLFDDLRFGGDDYHQFGESEPLRRLFEQAIEKLRIAAER